MRVWLAGIMLVVFAAMGVAHVVNPTYFLKRSGIRKGGELLTEWNALGFQMAGPIFAILSLYLLHALVSN